jgi:hypothetical protein
MLVRVFWQLCTEERVTADLTCCDSGVHLLFLRPADLRHHSDVSGCYYVSRIGPLIVRANLFESSSDFLRFSSVVLIGERAFYNSGLLTLIVPSSVEFIGSVDPT